MTERRRADRWEPHILPDDGGHADDAPSRLADLPPVVRKFMDRSGLKATGPRRAVIDVFMRCGGHVTIDELVHLLHGHKPRVSGATVYRVMRMLVAAGFAAERKFGRATHFEVSAGREAHDHLVCTNCGAIAEFTEPDLDALKSEVAERFGFAVTTSRLDLYGLCRVCSPKRPRHSVS